MLLWTQLIRHNGFWVDYNPPPLDKNDPEFEEIKAAIDEAMDEFDRGEGRPAREVFAELRAKHGISR